MSMLSSCDIIAFVATTDPERAREFYAGVLGLPPSRGLAALVFAAFPPHTPEHPTSNI